MNSLKTSQSAVRIASVRTVGGHVLALRWRDGRNFKVDLLAFIAALPVLRRLRNTATFQRVKLGEGGHSLVWPNGLDLGADRLWELTLEQNGRGDTAEFLRWRWRWGLSLATAAEALGLSRRQVAYYASGQHAVPRTVLLACKGWETEQGIAAA